MLQYGAVFKTIFIPRGTFSTWLDPSADPLVLPATTQTIASGRVQGLIPPAPGEPGYYVLCFDECSYHLIGPFGDADQLEQFVNYTDENDGPYQSPSWYPLLLDLPPKAPRIVQNTMPALPVEEVQRQRLKRAEEDAFLEAAYANWISKIARSSDSHV